MLNYHIGRIVLGSKCVGVSVWLGWSGIRVVGCFSLQSYCSWFDVCWSFGLVGLEWYPCCRLLQPSAIFFLVRCVLEFRCGWIGVVSVLQAEAACNTDTTPTQPHRNSNTHRTKNNTTNVAIQQNSRKLLMMDILISVTC